MAAITTTLLSLLRAGDHLLAGDALYGGTHDFLTDHAEDLGWSCSFVDTRRPETWAAAVTPSTRVFLLETISNPLVRVPRLREVVAFARSHGLVTVIDNTFATPVNFRPLAAGFDLVCHSATKYLNGHSDLVAGCVVGQRRAGRPRAHRAQPLRRRARPARRLHAGARAQDARAARGRAERQRRGARALPGRAPARARGQPPVAASHPDHAHAAELLSGFGGMLSVRLHGGAAAAQRLLDALTIPTVAPSLGGVESLVTLPAQTSHAGMSAEERERVGVTDDLVRISCGIEGTEDLIADFAQALEAASVPAAA